jgi:hypothetical protein
MGRAGSRSGTPMTTSTSPWCWCGRTRARRGTVEQRCNSDQGGSTPMTDVMPEQQAVDGHLRDLARPSDVRGDGVGEPRDPVQTASAATSAALASAARSAAKGPDAVEQPVAGGPGRVGSAVTRDRSTSRSTTSSADAAGTSSAVSTCSTPAIVAPAGNCASAQRPRRTGGSPPSMTPGFPTTRCRPGRRVRAVLSHRCRRPRPGTRGACRRSSAVAGAAGRRGQRLDRLRGASRTRRPSGQAGRCSRGHARCC